MGELITLDLATERFELFSIEPDFVQAFESDGKKMFRGVASSTTKDLHGDTILLEALEDMEKQAVGLTTFLNHSYNVPGDVGGTITKALVRQKGVDDDGNPNYQLEIEVEVEDENPEALKTWKYVKKGRRLGLSIGAMIPKGGAVRQKDGSLVINSLKLLEVSFVGIPANPKSWIEYAASAFRNAIAKSQSHALGNPTLTLEGGRYLIEGSLEGLDINLGADEPAPEIDYVFEQDAEGKVQITRTLTSESGATSTLLGAWDLSDEDDKVLAVATAGDDAVEKATVWVETRDGDKITIGEPVEAAADADVTASVEPDITDEACPTCGKDRGGTGCDDAYHKEAPEPDVTDAKVRIIEVDTDDKSDDSSQGASSSEPEDADETLAAPEADVTADGEQLILDGLPIEELTKLSFVQLQTIALRAVTELVSAKQALAEEKVARIAAEAQRDQVADAAAELVTRTAKIIEKVASAPLPRKAIIREAQKSFSADVEAYYGSEFARALAGK